MPRPPTLATEFIEFCTTYATLEDGSPYRPMPWEKKFFRKFLAKGCTRAISSTARKNAKTFKAALLCLGYLVGPMSRGLHNARILSVAAGNLKQGALVFEAMRGIVERSPELSARIEITPSTYRMFNTRNLNRFESMTTKAESAHGQHPVFWVFDEIAQAKNSRLYEAIEKSQRTSKIKSKGLIISTRSEVEGSPLDMLIEGIQEGQAAGQMKHWHLELHEVPMDYEDKGGDLYSMDAMAIANPGLGQIVSVESAKQEIEEALRMPGRRLAYRIYSLNQKISSDEKLFNIIDWQDCAGSFKREKLESQRCIGAIDLSSHTDLTGVVGYFPEVRRMIGNALVPSASLEERELDENVPYSEWVKSGHVKTSQGRAIEMLDLIDLMLEWEELYDMVEWRFDPYMLSKVTSAMTVLSRDGHPIPRAPIVSISQNIKQLSSGVDEVERLITTGELTHENNPVLNYCMANAGVEMKTEGSTVYRKAKKLHERKRIDLAVCAIMACGHREPSPEERKQLEKEAKAKRIRQAMEIMSRDSYSTAK